MLIDIPDDLAARAEQEARESGRSLRAVLSSVLRRAFGMSEEALSPQDETSEDTLVGAPSKPTPAEVSAALEALQSAGSPEFDALSDDELMELATRAVREDREEQVAKGRARG